MIAMPIPVFYSDPFVLLTTSEWTEPMILTEESPLTTFYLKWPIPPLEKPSTYASFTNEISEIRFWRERKLIDVRRLRNTDLKGVRF